MTEFRKLGLLQIINFFRQQYEPFKAEINAKVLTNHKAMWPKGVLYYCSQVEANPYPGWEHPHPQAYDIIKKSKTHEYQPGKTKNIPMFTMDAAFWMLSNVSVPDDTNLRSTFLTIDRAFESIQTHINSGNTSYALDLCRRYKDVCHEKAEQYHHVSDAEIRAHAEERHRREEQQRRDREAAAERYRVSMAEAMRMYSGSTLNSTWIDEPLVQMSTVDEISSFSPIVSNITRQVRSTPGNESLAQRQAQAEEARRRRSLFGGNNEG